MLKPLSLRFIAILACAGAGIGRSQTVIDSVDVGGNFVGGLIYNSRADVLYGNTEGAETFFAIACSTNRILTSWRIPRPLEAAYNSVGNKAYVASRGEMDSVFVIDGTTYQRIKAIPLEWATIPLWDSFSNRLYVSCLEMNEVGVIDCETDSVIDHIPVGYGPLKMHLNNRLRKLYVQNYDEGSVSIIDLLTHRVLRRIAVGRDPQSGYFSSWLQKYYCDGAGVTTVIGGQDDTVLARIPLPQGCNAYAMVGEDSGSLILLGIMGYATNLHYAIDGIVDSVLSVFPAGRGPQALWWSQSSGRFYCANGYSNDISVIDAAGTQILRTIPVGDWPFAFAYSPVQRRLYVGHLGCRWVFVIKDTATGIAEEPTAAKPGVALRVYPNPFRNEVHIGCEGTVLVFGSDGRMVRSIRPQTAEKALRAFVWVILSVSVTVS